MLPFRNQKHRIFPTARDTMKPAKNSSGQRPYGWRIKTIKVKGNREMQLHSTKGWRSYKK
jgi:hypothetical protein